MLDWISAVIPQKAIVRGGEEIRFGEDTRNVGLQVEAGPEQLLLPLV
jgi:hypothetical protein